MTTRHNPERRAWKGRSHKKGGKRVRELRDIGAQLRELAGKFKDNIHVLLMVEHAAENCEDGADACERSAQIKVD